MDTTEICEHQPNHSASIPGFDVFRNIFNSLTLRAQQGYPQDDMWLSLRIHGDRSDLDIGEIDMSSLSTSKSAVEEDITSVLLPLLTKDSLTRVVFPSRLVHEVRGMCKGAIVDAVRDKIGCNIDVAGKPISIRDFVMTEDITNKITDPSTMPAEQLSGVVKILHGVKNQHDIPFVLANAIVKAARHIKKLKRHHRTTHVDITKGENDLVENDMSTVSDDSLEDSENHEGISIPTKRNNKMSKPPKPLPPTVQGYLGSNMHCYVCKKKYSFPKKAKKVDTAWCQYPKMCHSCASSNYMKRHQRAELSGRYAVVTGGRIKIGFHIVLKLLRDGAHVIATTRFPRDAAKRFQMESDFDTFKTRLKIYPLEMKSLPAVYAFIEYVMRTFPHLDILINNAAQTISRPFAFYTHMLDFETQPFADIPPEVTSLLATTNVLNYYGDSQTGTGNDLASVDKAPYQQTSSQDISHSLTKRHHPDDSQDVSEGHKRLKSSRELTGMRDITADGSSLESSQALSFSSHFPVGLMDADGQQLDLRPMNSWRMPMEEVPLSEVLQVLAVNSVAPFILTQKLKPLLDKSPHRKRFIVNVSAMEGQFNRLHKNHYHPHTNMAKAALNMMTRTVAMGYSECGVYMTAVDTGWVTDERPFPQAQYEQQKGFVLPLDAVDGAARVYDPVVSGLNDEQEPFYAVFLKDYQPYPW